MRALSLFAILLCAPTALAVEVADSEKPATATSAVEKTKAAKTQSPPNTAKAEAAKSDAAKAEAAKAEAAKKLPLHEHPTLLAMLKRNNELREGVGLKPQRISPELTQAAQFHANYMARSGDFNHYSNLGPWGRARRFLYRGGNVRENIAMGQRSVAGAFVAWRNSGGHWASITSNTEEAGFGYAVSQGGTPYWVGMYGNPDMTVAPKPAADQLAADDAQPPAPPADIAAEAQSNDNSSGNYYSGGHRRLLRFRR